VPDNQGLVYKKIGMSLPFSSIECILAFFVKNVPREADRTMSGFSEVVAKAVTQLP